MSILKRLSPAVLMATALAVVFGGSLFLSLSNLPSPIQKALAASPANEFLCAKTFSPGALTTLTQTSTTVTCPGVALGDLCDGVSSSVDPGAGIILSCNVSAANTVRIQVFNSTAGTITPASATYAVLMQPFYKSP